MTELFKEQQRPVEQTHSELGIVPQRVPQNLPRVEIVLNSPEQSLKRVAASLRTRSEGSFTAPHLADQHVRMAGAVDALHLEAGSNLPNRFGRMVSGTQV